MLNRVQVVVLQAHQQSGLENLGPMEMSITTQSTNVYGQKELEYTARRLFEYNFDREIHKGI